jgi:hypothetical protein
MHKGNMVCANTMNTIRNKRSEILPLAAKRMELEDMIK